MDALPFSEDEWSRMSEACLTITNATLNDDDIREELGFDHLKEIINDLEMNHGSHPALIEVLADYTADTEESVRLYEKARIAAEKIE